ncbi:DUF5821 family protein [Halobaculum sp. MBLA0147]|uniref:transcriptional regulator TbsP domain-containing protein n=1 Tax=Halobaculum sp. MBLA0147 TaxID=3079934 RepID=UPI003525D550
MTETTTSGGADGHEETPERPSRTGSESRRADGGEGHHAATATTTASVVETLRELLASAEGGRQYLLDPPPAFLEALEAAVDQVENPPTLRLLAPHDTLVWLRTRHHVATRVADLIADDVVRLRETPLADETPALVGPNRLSALVLVGDAAATLRTTETDVPGEVYERAEQLWADAESFSLRTPPLSETLATGERTLGEAFRADFAESLTVAAALDDASTYHPVRAGLAIAARHELLHYDVSRWGDRTGVASTASFSRHKSTLEERGVIETEKVPVETGRPRQRLLLTDEYRRLADEEGLAALIRAAAVDD